MTDQSELDQLAETELEKLQKQLRALEGDRIIFTEDGRKRSSKNEAIIALLRKEKDQLEFDLSLITTGKPAQRKTELDANIFEIMQEQDSALILIKNQKKNMWELEEHIKKLEKEIRMLRTSTAPTTTHNESIMQVQKCIGKLKNRLDVGNKRCGGVISENTQLRQLIDHMLSERAQFNEMWQKLVANLNQGKKYITDLIEQSTAAYDQRDELCNKLQTLRDKGQAEKMTHIQEMRELQRKLDHDANIQAFFTIKNRKRSSTESDAREMNKQLRQQEELTKQLEHYQEILQTIQSFTEEKDIKLLAVFYTKQEEENFALFNYVNELSNEVEILNDSVQLLENDVRDQRDDNEFKNRSQDDAMDILEKERFFFINKVEKVYQTHEYLTETLQYLLNGIQRVFRLAHYEDTPVLNLLGVEKRITVHNVKLFLGIVERRSNQLINMVTFADQTVKILANKNRIPKFNIKDIIRSGSGSGNT